MNYRSLLRNKRLILPGTKRFPWSTNPPPPRYLLQPLLIDSLANRLEQRIETAGTQTTTPPDPISPLLGATAGGLAALLGNMKQQFSTYLAGNSIRVLFNLPNRQALHDWQQSVLDGSQVSFRTLANLINTVSRHSDHYLSQLTGKEGKISLPLMSVTTGMSAAAPVNANKDSTNEPTTAETPNTNAATNTTDNTDSQQPPTEFTVCPTELFSKLLLQRFAEGLHSLSDEGRAIFLTPPQLSHPSIDDMRLLISLVVSPEQMQRLPEPLQSSAADDESMNRVIPFFHHWVSVRPERRLRSLSDGSGGKDTVSLSIDVRVDAKFNFIIYESNAPTDREPEVFSTISVDRPMVLTMRSVPLPFEDGTIGSVDRERLEWTLIDVDSLVNMDQIWQRVVRQMQNSESAN
jgi:hypothetical protein